MSGTKGGGCRKEEKKKWKFIRGGSLRGERGLFSQGKGGKIRDRTAGRKG